MKAFCKEEGRDGRGRMREKKRREKQYKKGTEERGGRCGIGSEDKKKECN